MIEGELMSDQPKFPYVGVGCVIADDDGRLLLVRRRGAHGAGSWSTPGGHLDFGESPETCAVREAQEETGIVVGDMEFLGVTNDYFEGEEKHYITLWFGGVVDDSAPAVPQLEETAEIGWFEAGALPEPLFVSFENLISGRSLAQLPANSQLVPVLLTARTAHSSNR
jgi:8-oxo-dGTP diphosphatase